MTEWTTEQLVALRERLVAHFSMGELQTLAFDLGMDFEELGGEGKTAKARELVSYARRHGHLEALLRLAAAQRPHVAWDAPPSGPAPAPSPAPDERARTERTLAMAAYLSKETLFTLIQAIVGANMATHDGREQLLMGIHPGYRASLPTRSDPFNQIWSDLEQMNSAPRLADGEAPLRLWLLNAAQRFHIQGRAAEQALFDSARATVEAELARGDASVSLPDSLPTPAPSLTPDERARTERTLAMARRALEHLEEQAAGYGKLALPTHLRIELEDKRAEVAALEAKLL